MVLKDIRKQAREALTGKWGKGALIILTYFAISLVLSLLNSLLKDIAFLKFIIEIATIVINIPIAFGLINSFFRLKNGEEVKFYDFLTFGFKNFGRSWKIAGNILLKMWLPILLYIVAIIIITIGAAIGISAGVIAKSTAVLIITYITCAILFIAAFAFMIIKSLNYTVSYIVACDNVELSAKEAVEESEKLMKGYRGKYVLLQLSFIGWIILSLLTIYIGLLWLIPYMQIASICFYEYIKENKKEEIAE